MNVFSVTGKNWIFRKFNNGDILKLSEQYSLTETVAKLLSIRKDSIDDIDLFTRRTTFTPATAFQFERVVPRHALAGCTFVRSKNLSESTNLVKKNMNLAPSKSVPQVKLPPVKFKGKGWN